jgi:hypothetical protein
MGRWIQIGRAGMVTEITEFEPEDTEFKVRTIVSVGLPVRAGTTS